MESRKLIDVNGKKDLPEHARIDTDGDGVIIMPALNSKIYEEVGRMCNRALWIFQLAAAANTLIDAWKE